MHDVVIVGAGSAGCVLAARLTENPSTSVLLLEAGPRDRKLHVRVPAAFSKLFGSPLDWGYRTTPQAALDGRRLVFPRGRVLGGSSSINAMMAIRGHRADHDAWPHGWSWDDVADAYRRSDARFPRATQRHPSPLTLDFLESAAATGIPRVRDLNAGDNEGVGLTPVSIRRGRRYSVVDGYLRTAMRRPNLTVVTGARVTRLLVDRGRARGVAYLAGASVNEEEAHAGREVVLAAGAIDTPKLLLLSGIGPPDELDRHGLEVVVASPGVGRNLKDHLANGVLASVAAETLFSAERPRHLLAWLAYGRGPLTSNVAEAAAFVRTDPGAPAPDLELIFAPVLFEEEGMVPPSQDGVTVATVVLQPRSVGEVRLASRNPLAEPEIDPRYLTDPEGRDAALLLDGIRRARRILATEPLARHVTGELLPGADAADDAALHGHLRARSQTLYHPVGTCRMGEDEAAVVGPDLRVRGVDGLRVVDASVIPGLPRGHTNWPTVMVAERGAELMRAP
ncbi:MAG TPA: GMC family oxidoreductase N-terminal domain-containing protein [Gaiella sp.]|nr:GMC family oxidoreductase N-terminal domain-containing protein [Gaiella sp.]